MNVEFEDYRQKFNKLLVNGKFSRLGRTFDTETNKYFYDTGTGKVFQIEEHLYSIINSFIRTNDFNSIFELALDEEQLLTELKTLFETIEQQHILQAPPVHELYGPQVYELDEALARKRTQLMLELTEECNMRCKYCIYHAGNGGYREFGKEGMTFEIAKLALDRFLTDSEEKELYVSFYGGEPLLRYEMIKQCTRYCIENYPKKNIRFTMTTNGTLMTEEIASYIASLPNAIITVSLDGPEEIHDSNRVFYNNTGTFKKALAGLKLLVDAFGERAGQCLIINTVLVSVDSESLSKIQQFFDSIEWLPKEVIHTSSYVDTKDEEVDYQGVDGERENRIREYAKKEKMNYNPVATWGTKAFMEGHKDVMDIEGIARDGFVKDLLSIHRRFLVEKPGTVYGMNGCCVPGARKIYVTVKGDYLVCEKMGPSPRIGNVYDGIDVEQIKKYYVERFRKEAVKYCGECWAINLCNICYTECYDEDDINFNKRHKRCEAHRVSKEKILAAYHEILEKSPESLSFLDDYELA